jgi:TPR repeat protein
VIQLAVARIALPRLGTAFAIDLHTAVTAWHCVRDPDNDSNAVDAVELQFPGDELVSARVGPGDATQDWVTLELTTSLPLSLQPIPLRRDVQAWDLCVCHGFPRTAAEFGCLPILATVSGETERDGVPLLTLEADTVGRRLDPRGLSGGPVVPRRTPVAAVGLVSRRLMDSYGEEQVGGVLFACPARLVAAAPMHAATQPQEDPELLREGLAAAARAGDVSAAARLGHLLFADDHAGEAEAWLRQAASGGDPVSAYTLGMLIDPDGTLIERDRDRAQESLAWFRRAATGGDIYGATTMGIRLRQHGRDDAALPWLEEAIERGADAMAAHTLGRIYDDRRDLARAEQWERFAARRGDVRAAYDLGRILKNRGERDQSIFWLRQAKVDPDAIELLRELGVEPE